MQTSRVIDGVNVPAFLYGTAWKEDRTAELVTLALDAGFRGIDTANQRKHYFEAAVGEALAAAFTRGLLTRDELFLQTKFTFRGGQDHRLPYDPAAPVATQVEQSLAKSLEHLRVDRLDSYVLHGPSTRGWVAADREAWVAMESLHDQGLTRFLGVSNVSLEQLQTLVAEARVPPTFVQNRCYAVRGWDRAVRSFCAENNLVYQGFSLLTANRDVLARSEVQQIARRLGRTVCQVIFRFAQHAGMLPLTGTSNPQHMQEDLATSEFELTPADCDVIERLAD